MAEIAEAVGAAAFEGGYYDEARNLSWELTVSREFEEILTSSARERPGAGASL